jgi:DNA-binding HxlR family transcriptional regulator
MRNPAPIASLPAGASAGASRCSVLGALTIVGDFWTLGLLRCLFNGLSRFGELQRELGIASNVLADRLGRLVHAGILERVPAGKRHRYVLTPTGAELAPMVLALKTWGDRHLTPQGPTWIWHHAGCASPAEVQVRCPDCGELLDLPDIQAAPR